MLIKLCCSGIHLGYLTEATTTKKHKHFVKGHPNTCTFQQNKVLLSNGSAVGSDKNNYKISDRVWFMVTVHQYGV